MSRSAAGTSDRVAEAAPNMLAVLRRFEATFGQAVDEGEDINGADAVEFIVEHLDDVRAAIAKADGDIATVTATPGTGDRQ